MPESVIEMTDLEIEFENTLRKMCGNKSYDFEDLLEVMCREVEALKKRIKELEKHSTNSYRVARACKKMSELME